MKEGGQKQVSVSFREDELSRIRDFKYKDMFQEILLLSRKIQTSGS